MKTLTSKIVLGSITAALLMTGCGDTAQSVKASKKAATASSSFASQASTDGVVTAGTVADASALTPDSSDWNSAAFTNVTLYPQTTIKGNDKEANMLNKANLAKVAKVAALQDGKNVAIAVIWEDKSENQHNGKCTDSYADAIALQFAKEVTDAAKLPYIGMGSEGREVAIYVKKNKFNNYEPNGDMNAKGTAKVETQVNRHQTNAFDADLAAYDKQVVDLGSDNYERKFVSAGFRSLTEIKDGSATSTMKMSRIPGYGWIATLVRPLSDDYATLKDTTPVAFAIWDGNKNNRNGLKVLSSWIPVVVSKKDDALVTALTEQVKGDVANGQAQAVANCSSCHNFPGAEARGYDISAYAGPDLSNIGGYATASYIKESMMDPSAVVVPGYNQNAHVSSPWYMITDGKRASMMPAFDYLDAKSVTDIVAFMQTLKTAPTKVKGK